MKNNRKKKAFTLTELLVVVIVIGVLSAVVLPKFSKVIETRKTTEAEEMMAAVRTEQERRCSLDKNYTTDAAAVNLASLNTKNFNYTLKNTGIEAASTGKYGYTLKMPSYRDGRLCCDSAEQCAKLNKNYPLCSELTAKADYTIGEECSAEEPLKTCEGPSTRACGCKNGGTQTRTCDTTTGTWSAWGDCSIPDDCECTDKKPDSSRKCGCKSRGTQTRSVTCDPSTGKWKTGNWSNCPVGPCPTPPPGPDPKPDCTECQNWLADCKNLGQGACECGACASCPESGGSECGGSECGGSDSGGSGSGGSACGGLGGGDDMNCVLCTYTAMLNESIVCSKELLNSHVDSSCQIIEKGGYHCTQPHVCNN